MKNSLKMIFIFCIFSLLIINNIVYASMADYTDKQADEQQEKVQQEWKQEKEERINKSSNNYLKSLSVKNYDITPSFDKQTINYEIKNNITEDYIEIEAETDDEKSSVSGIGKVDINSGENNFKIDVSAENGTVRSYFIKVTKKDENEISENKTENEIQETEISNSSSNNSSTKIIIIAAVIIVVILIIAIVYFCKKIM